MPVETTLKDKAVRIYQTIKKNKSILNDTRRALTERQKDRLTRDNMILLEELNKITNKVNVYRTKKESSLTGQR